MDTDIENGKAKDIRGFCDNNDISPSHYFVLQSRGEGPVVMRVGKRVLITPRAERAWRRKREAAARKAAAEKKKAASAKAAAAIESADHPEPRGKALDDERVASRPHATRAA
jgi:hypothetical protein